MLVKKNAKKRRSAWDYYKEKNGFKPKEKDDDWREKGKKIGGFAKKVEWMKKKKLEKEERERERAKKSKNREIIVLESQENTM